MSERDTYSAPPPDATLVGFVVFVGIVSLIASIAYVLSHLRWVG